MVTKTNIGGEVSDEQLLKILSSNKEHALKLLYCRFWKPLYVQARKVLGDGKASEDVVQEVFIDLWEKDSYDHIWNFQAYIYQAMKYKTLMALRKRRITERHLEIFWSLNPVQNPFHDLLAGELEDEITRQLEKLPPKCREVFYKSRFEHFDNQEIADQLHISKRTVETHISHALRYLRGVKEMLVIIIWWGW